MDVLERGLLAHLADHEASGKVEARDGRTVRGLAEVGKSRGDEP